MNYIILIIKYLTVFILINNSYTIYGQVFEAEQNPPSVTFNKIESKNFTVIYPIELSYEANKVATRLESLIADVGKSINQFPHPITIVLQNQGTESNAFVTMAPRRSEFYTIPGQEFDMQDWLMSLCLHELRHVSQFDKLGKKLKAPFFEQLKLAIFGLNLPPWLFEGDAVAIETLLSDAGRGRQPNFNLSLRANTLSNKKYSYSKNYFGSVKDVTPNYYPLGYFMVTKMRKDYGEKILDTVLTKVSTLPFRPFNLSNSLKKYTGINTKELHRNTLIELDSLWQHQQDKSTTENYNALHHINSNNPSNYLLPYQLSDSSFICIKTSKAFVSTITQVFNNKQEKKILSIGYQTEPNLNYANNKLVWDEYRSDKRFLQRSYSVINLFDLITKKHKQITSKSRLFSPALSANGKSIIAVKVSTSNQFNLVEIDLVTGKEINHFKNPENYILQTPSYNYNDSLIVVTAVNHEGKTLIVYDKRSKTFEKLFPFQRQLFSRPVFYNNHIVYKAHYNGIDNIYQFDLKTKKITQLTYAKFGAYNPSIFKNLLIFNDYQYYGYNVSKINLQHTNKISIDSISDNFVAYFKSIQSQENPKKNYDSIPIKYFPEQRYKEFKHLINFHSISPVLNNISSDNAAIGFNLLSNNLLGTTAVNLGYQYHQGFRKNQFNASITYAKFYPKFALTFENRPRIGYVNYISGNNNKLTTFTYREYFQTFSITLPYYKNWLNHILNISFELGTSYTKRFDFIEKPKNFSDLIAFPLKYATYFNLNNRRSARDLAPRFGQNVSLEYNHMPFNGKSGSNFFRINSQFYFPGLFTNHSFQASINYQHANGAYKLSNDIFRASGFAQLEAIKNLRNTILLDYRFPIFYPDWEIGPLAYIKRIKGGIFTDFENIETNGLRTYGVECRADMNLLRYYLPNFDIGGKAIFIADKSYKSPIFEFTFSYNL